MKRKLIALVLMTVVQLFGINMAEASWNNETYYVADPAHCPNQDDYDMNSFFTSTCTGNNVACGLSGTNKPLCFNTSGGDPEGPTAGQDVTTSSFISLGNDLADDAITTDYSLPANNKGGYVFNCWLPGNTGCDGTNAVCNASQVCENRSRDTICLGGGAYGGGSPGGTSVEGTDFDCGVCDSNSKTACSAENTLAPSSTTCTAFAGEAQTGPYPNTHYSSNSCAVSCNNGYVVADNDGNYNDADGCETAEATICPSGNNLVYSGTNGSNGWGDCSCTGTTLNCNAAASSLDPAAENTASGGTCEVTMNTTAYDSGHDGSADVAQAVYGTSCNQAVCNGGYANCDVNDLTTDTNNGCETDTTTYCSAVAGDSSLVWIGASNSCSNWTLGSNSANDVPLTTEEADADELCQCATDQLDCDGVFVGNGCEIDNSTVSMGEDIDGDTITDTTVQHCFDLGFENNTEIIQCSAGGVVCGCKEGYIDQDGSGNGQDGNGCELGVQPYQEFKADEQNFGVSGEIGENPFLWGKTFGTGLIALLESNDGGVFSIDNQGRVGIGTGSANENAGLDMKYAEGGFLMPQMTSTERGTFEAGLGTADEGLLIYDTTDNAIYIWDGAAWNTVAGSTAGSGDGAGVLSQSLSLIPDYGAVIDDSFANNKGTLTLSGSLRQSEDVAYYLWKTAQDTQQTIALETKIEIPDDYTTEVEDAPSPTVAIEVETLTATSYENNIEVMVYTGTNETPATSFAAGASTGWNTLALTPQTFSGMSAGDDIRIRMIMTATNTGSVKLGPVHFYYKN